MKDEMTFSDGDYVVYPAHGVGKVVGVEIQHVSGMELKVLVISFDNDRMKLRLPVAKAFRSGLRALTDGKEMSKALEILQGKSKIKKTMWSRRAQEYETKINSGDPSSIAEVIRDLHRTDEEGEQSYSERQLYQMAIERLTRELAAVESIDEEQAIGRLQLALRAA
ncbi:MAG: CarD family transcriptional regulator [Alphaproteobacteria bacterium]|nr:CarD family transcriptional regulator [Alphaproteobacteria bacterium]